MESYLKVVKLLLKNGAPVNSKDTHNATPIFLAVNCGSCEATQLLIGKYTVQKNLGRCYATRSQVFNVYLSFLWCAKLSP